MEHQSVKVFQDQRSNIPMGLLISLSVLYVWRESTKFVLPQLKINLSFVTYLRDGSSFFLRLCFIRIPGEPQVYFVPTIGKRTCSRRYANRYCPRRYVASNCLS